MYVKCHTGVAVGLSTSINMIFRCWHLRSRLQFYNVHDGSLNMLNDSINRHFTGLLGYDTALTLPMQDNLFHAFGVVCWPFFFKITFRNLSGTLSECQMIRIQIRTDVLTVLNWV